jgi:hypothetical protein
VSSSEDDGGGLGADQVQSIAESVVRGLVPQVVRDLGTEARKLLTNPYAYIIGTVLAFVVEDVLTPLFEGIVTAGTAMLTAILTVFLGGDLALSADGPLGIADAPLWLADRLIGGGDAIGGPVVGFYTDLNGAIAGLAAQAGPAAPLVAAGLYGGLLFLTGYALWSLIQVIDIPLIQLSGALRVVGWPIRKLLEVTR